MKRLQLATLVIGLMLTAQTRAAVVFELNYSDSSGNVASGELTAIFTGGNTFQAISGFLDVTASTSTPSVVGHYSLLPGSPTGTYSPSGAFIYNDVLYYPHDPYLDVNGLLGFASASGIELNLWGNSSGNYSLYAWEPTLGYTLQYTGDATTSITAVPEPTTMIAGALLLLPFGASALRILRKSTTA